MLNRFHGGDTIADARWRDGFEPWPEGRDRAEAGMALDGKNVSLPLGAMDCVHVDVDSDALPTPGSPRNLRHQEPASPRGRPAWVREVHPAGCLIYHGRQCPRPKFDKRGKRHAGLGMLRSARERARQKAGFTVKVQQEDGS